MMTLHESLPLFSGAIPVFVNTGVVVEVVEDVLPAGVVPPEGAGVVHVALVIVSLISVTLPLRASSRPCMFAPLATVIDVRARMLPLNTAVELIVAVLTCQKTLQAWAPLMRDTVLPGPTVSPVAPEFI